MAKHQTKILDTNVYLTNPGAILSFMPKQEDVSTTVLLPLVVLRELEKFKDEKSERGRNARAVFNELKDMSEAYGGSLTKGIEINQNYNVKSSYEIEMNLPNTLEGIVNEDNDRKLLEIVKKLKESGEDVELITLDTSLNITGNAIGLPVSEWRDFRVTEAYKGWREVEVGYELVNEFYNMTRKKGAENRKGFSPEEIPEISEPHPNEYFILKSGNQECPLMYDSKKQMYVPLHHYNNKKSHVDNIGFRQGFLMDALRNPDISVIFAIGSAGSGKTFLATDAAVEQVIMPIERQDKPNYQKVLITRPLIGIKDEEDIGALPGEIDEKLAPWMKPIYDQIDYVCNMNKLKDVDLEYFIEHDMIEIQAMIHIRGRSLHNCFWIVDEAQNMTRTKILTVGTRVSEGSKLIFTGDPSQCDLRLVHYASNPIVYASNVFKDSPLSATIYFEDKDCVRSRIASEFIERMG